MAEETCDTEAGGMTTAFTETVCTTKHAMNSIHSLC
jgi:hypothetical protein